MADKTRVAICGATGYTGFELIRLLLNHPNAEITSVTSRQSAGMKMSRVLHAVAGRCDLELEQIDPDVIAEKADVVFTALPHKEAMDTVAAFIERGKKVVDLSADFRLRDQSVYEEWYQAHSQPRLIEEAVYGLPELYREKIRGARLIANPGCYPTATVLAAAPLIKSGRAQLTHVIADCKSGASGAGRKATQALSFAEVNEGVKAYSVFAHRHTPEITQELSALAGKDVGVTFTPHLIPMQRGILSTVYLQLEKPMSTEALRDFYRDFYAGEPFVRVLPGTDVPRTRDVAGSNYCDLAPVAGPGGRVICLGAIDNLIKGASGAAVQNMNLMLGLEETAGLEGVAVVP